MKQQRIFIGIFASLLITTFIASIFSVAVVGDVSSQNLMQNVTIDGDIKDGEWDDADWYNIPFYLDANNTHGDADGFNYLSLGEDTDNILISIDLCSDRTDNDDGEWLGVWLNTAEREFGQNPFGDPYLEWYDYLNNGTENIVYDVENEQTYPFFQNETVIENRYINGDSEMDILSGDEVNSDDDYLEFRQSFNYYEFESDIYIVDELIWLNFSVDIEQWFNNSHYGYDEYAPDFVDTYIDSIEDINVTITLNGEGFNNTQIDASNVTFPNSTGYLDYDDPEYTYPLPFNDSQDVTTVFDYNITDLTADNKLKFELFCYNDSTAGEFQINIKTISFQVKFGRDNIILKHSSIESYDIAYTFGKSPNCNASHRMFELAIPKSELELYDPDEKLGIFIAGYGTLSIEYYPQWWYGASGSWFYPIDSNTYLYLDMQGDELPPEEPEPEPDPFVDPFWTIVIIVVIVVGAIIVALVGLLAYVRKDDDCICRGLPGCKCDI